MESEEIINEFYNQVKILVRRIDYDASIGFLICEKDRKLADRRVARPIDIILEPQRMPVIDTFCFSPGVVQGLMDQLWQCGFRPTDAKSGNQTIEAKKNILQI